MFDTIIFRKGRYHPSMKKAFCMWFAMFICIVTSNSPEALALTSPEQALQKTIVKSQPVATEAKLIEKADFIVYGWFDSPDRELPTGQNIGSGKLVNYVQTFHVVQSMKGRSPQLIRVLSTGIEPMPDADDPSNAIYPGPMIEGSYVCFLKKVPNTSDVYALIGGWQGVYPVHDEKTIALEDAGFADLGGLTLKQFEQKIRR